MTKEYEGDKEILKKGTATVAMEIAMAPVSSATSDPIAPSVEPLKSVKSVKSTKSAEELAATYEASVPFRHIQLFDFCGTDELKYVAYSPFPILPPCMSHFTLFCIGPTESLEIHVVCSRITLFHIIPFYEYSTHEFNTGNRRL